MNEKLNQVLSYGLVALALSSCKPKDINNQAEAKVRIEETEFKITKIHEIDEQLKKVFPKNDTTNQYYEK